MSLRQPTGNPGGRRALPGWDNDAHAVVATSSHGSAPGVHHEANQEPAERKKKGSNPNDRIKWRGKRLVKVKTRQVNVGEERKRNGMSFLCCIISILNLISGKMG